MKQLSMWVMGLAVFGTSVALADPTLPPPSATSAVPNAGCCAPQVPCLGNCCDNGGCCCEHLGGLIGGVGLYLVQPCFSNNPSYAVVSSPTAGGGTSTISRVDVNQHMDVAPEIWLGYIGDNGFGGRARWWYFRQDSNQSLAFPTASGGTTIDVFSAAPLGVPVHAFNDDGPLTFNDTTKLQLDVFDVEALQDIQVAGFDLLFSAGLRFAHINQQYNAFGTFTEVVEPLSSVISSHSFNGLGPVVDLEARRAIGNSGLVLYGCARGALLFGSEHQTAFASVPVDFVAGTVSQLNQSNTNDRVVPVGELELGLEYGRRLGNARVFAQIALVGQDWFGVGNASRSLTSSGSSAFGTSSLSTGLPSTGATGDSDLGFLGLAFRVGLNY